MTSVFAHPPRPARQRPNRTFLNIPKLLPIIPCMSNILWNDEPDKPLQHLRVVDMTVMLPGPYLTRILAQYGADVVKVEALPHGDQLRTLPNSSAFELMNQGKRSLACDLKNKE